MEPSSKMELRRARMLAFILSSLLVFSFICLIYAVNLNVKIEKLTKESIELKKQLEDCHKSTSN
jgi:preprotein translocase subunit SecF